MRTHCLRGHLFTAETTYTSTRANGTTMRYCKICNKMKAQEGRDRKKHRARVAINYEGVNSTCKKATAIDPNAICFTCPMPECVYVRSK